jgi:copper chaperone CopZ
MKKIMVILSVLLIAITVSNNANSQSCCGSKKTSCNKKENSAVQNTSATTDPKDSLIVNGKCGMCKSRIETATKNIKGVTDAQWDQSTHILTYNYTGTVKKEDISKALNTVGHDTEYGKAQDKVYNKLPACCKYRE